MKKTGFLLLSAGMLLLNGCAVQKQEAPEYSVEIIDVSTTEAAQTETAAAETSAETTALTTAATVTARSTTSLTAKTAKTTTKLTKKTVPTTTASSYQLSQPLTDISAITTTATLNEDGSYTTKEDVALYIHTYHKLPKNYITKKQAQDLGWNGGSLEPYAPGCSIGGSYFGNYEGKLPEKKGRSYLECDIDTRGAKLRGTKRLVFSNDGLIYYTSDHYQTFELLYGEVS